MARINLLPWRETQRQQRQRNFLVALAGTALLAAALVFVGAQLIDRQIGGQDARNGYLRAEIAKLDRDIATIEQLEQTRDNLLARKNVIERLQENRSMMVHLFNHLARTAPEGVRLSSVRQTGEDITLQGTTQSETRVSDYMRNIEQAEWMHQPELRIIEARSGAETDAQPFRFELRARVASPKAVEDDELALAGGEES